MVLAFSERSERSAKVSHPANLSPAAPLLELPRFKWGAVRLMRCQLAHVNCSFPETDSGKKVVGASAAADLEATRPAVAPCEQKDHSFDPLLRHEDGSEKKKRKKEKMTEFRITLTKDEIDEDFFGMTAARAPRRPRRRPKAVQGQIECLYPGLLLPRMIAPDRYRVPN